MTERSSDNVAVACSGVDDPRLYDVDDEFRDLLAGLSGFAVASKVRKARFFHSAGVTLRGTMRIVDTAPEHEFLRRGAAFPLLVRYSNALAPDDASPSVRGATLRLLDPQRPDDPSDSLLDLPLNTGQAFYAGSAAVFVRASASLPERQAVLEEFPELRSTLWGSYRAAASYAEYHYYSQVPRCFTTADGVQWYARFRLLPEETGPEPGIFDPGELWLPPDPPESIPRDPADTRPADFMHREIEARAEAGGVRGLLQVQLHPAGPEHEHALDASWIWPERDCPWFDLAQVELDAVAPAETVEGLCFNPVSAPPGMGIAVNPSPQHPASINHLRSLLYQMTAAARRGEPMHPRLSALLRPAARSARPAPRADVSEALPARTVCVVGGGPAGLSAARELERRGHRAIVLEAEPEVGGKCGSVTISERPYDLGGHICTTQYTRLAELVTDLGIATEDTTAHRIYDIASAGERPQDAAFFRRASVERYRALRAQQFPDIAEPGLAHSAAALSTPVSAWLAEHGLESLATSLGTGATAAGYGYLDPDLPALYFVKYAEMTGLLSSRAELLGHPGSFTIVGGFQTLWQKAAERLADVRRDARVQRIERTGTGVRVHLADNVIEADDVLLTIPLDQALPLLADPDEQERDLAGRTRAMDYYTVMCTATGLPRDAFHLIEAHTASATSRGHVVAMHHRYPDRDEYACYAYGARDGGEEEIRRLLAEDIERMGGRLERVHLVRRWAFMPYFSSEDLAAGILDRFERNQGRRNTYIAGGMLAFETVESNIAYAQDLVRRHFPAQPGAVCERDRRESAVAESPKARTALTEAQLRTWLVDHVAAELRTEPDQVDPAAPLEQYGLESMSVAAIQAALSDLLGFRVAHTLCFECPTIDAIPAYLIQDAGGDAGAETSPSATPSSRLLLPLVPPQPFFILGGIVGAAYYLRPLARALGPGHPVYGIQAPGLDGTEEPLDRVEDFAARCVEEITRVQPAGPYRVGGHSFGGLVAYETARLLRAAGHEVRLILIDTFVPTPDRDLLEPDDLAALQELAEMNRLISGDAEAAVDSNASFEDQIAQLGRLLGASGALPTHERIADMLGVYQANLDALIDYRPPPADVRVHLFKADSGFPQVMKEGRTIELRDGPDNGWAAIVGADNLEVVSVPGDHFTLCAEPNIKVLGREIGVRLTGM